MKKLLLAAALTMAATTANAAISNKQMEDIKAYAVMMNACYSVSGMNFFLDAMKDVGYWVGLNGTQAQVGQVGAAVADNTMPMVQLLNQMGVNKAVNVCSVKKPY